MLPIAIFLFTWCTIMGTAGEPSPIIFLENQDMRIGVDLSSGGRIFHFGTTGGNNVLKNHPTYARVHFNGEPATRLAKQYVPVPGNSVWPSPMEEWWLKQDLFPEKKQNGHRWPPDPYLEYSTYKLVFRDSSQLIIESPESPVSGISIRKKIKIDRNRMDFVITFTNIRDTAISWGIWTNTRLDAAARCFVPVEKPGQVFFKTTKSENYDSLKYSFDKGYFSYLPPSANSKRAFQTSKAFITPSKPYIAAITEKTLLVIRLDKTEIPGVHPAQTFIEIFNQFTSDPLENLLELEHHSPYRKIHPGESIQTSETWYLFPLPEQTGENDQINILLDIEEQILNLD